jgi:hypothetical protein
LIDLSRLIYGKINPTPKKITTSGFYAKFNRTRPHEVGPVRTVVVHGAIDYVHASRWVAVLTTKAGRGHSCGRCGRVRPENAFFVDDTEVNVLSAKRMGINAVLFRDAKSLSLQIKSHLFQSQIIRSEKATGLSISVRILYFKISSFPLAGMIITCNPFPAKIIPPFSPS